MTRGERTPEAWKISLSLAGVLACGFHQQPWKINYRQSRDSPVQHIYIYIGVGLIYSVVLASVVQVKRISYIYVCV